jgi:7-cyano-7-deazaguanine synthase in queuosine biosynthesis
LRRDVGYGNPTYDAVVTCSGGPYDSAASLPWRECVSDELLKILHEYIERHNAKELADRLGMKHGRLLDLLNPDSELMAAAFKGLPTPSLLH